VRLRRAAGRPPDSHPRAVGRTRDLRLTDARPDAASGVRTGDFEAEFPRKAPVASAVDFAVVIAPDLL
jgi:hypothetical protein